MILNHELSRLILRRRCRSASGHIACCPESESQLSVVQEPASPGPRISPKPKLISSIDVNTSTGSFIAASKRLLRPSFFKVPKKLIACPADRSKPELTESLQSAITFAEGREESFVRQYSRPRSIARRRLESEGMQSDNPSSHSNQSSPLKEKIPHSRISQLYLQRLMNYKLTEPIVLQPIDICVSRCKDLSTPTKSILRNRQAESLRIQEAETPLRLDNGSEKPNSRPETPGKRVRFSRNKIVKVFASKKSSSQDDA